ncbi:MAG TPA: hypothetical protein VM889_02650 [Candidatus Thermoplasmatota archaeon]|nr:hypothetical protein [Candidatus Thermoplasmatota archaeon]
MGRSKPETTRAKLGDLVLDESLNAVPAPEADVQPFHVAPGTPTPVLEKAGPPRILVEGNLTIQEATTWAYTTQCTGSVQIASGSRLRGDLVADGLTSVGTETFIEGSVRAKGRLEWGLGSTATEAVEGAPFVTVDGEVAKKLVARSGIGVVTDEAKPFGGGA